MLIPEHLAEHCRKLGEVIGTGEGFESAVALTDHIDAQQSRIAELEKDAARYRWMRGNLGKTVSHWICTEGGETLDEEIDAKMQK